MRGVGIEILTIYSGGAKIRRFYPISHIREVIIYEVKFFL